MKINDLIQKLEQEIVSTQNSLQQAESLIRLKEIAKVYKGEDEVVDFDFISERVKNEQSDLKIMTGWSNFDSLIKGFRPQQLIVISAATKSGKTSFLMDLNTKIEEYNPVWFPFEESAEELLRKYIERGEEPPKAYTPKNMTGNSVSWVETKIVESIAKYNSRVVFIDHLDYIVSFTADSHSLRVGQAMRELKALAKKWNVVIFVLCHLVKTRMDEQPTMEDLRGSSSIGQEADTVIFLWRETKKERGEVIITDNVNVSVQANRRTGKTGNVKMIFDNGHFIEKEWLSAFSKASKDYENFT